MSKNKGKRDIITEQDFNLQIEEDKALPENDSPDDSDESLNSEYLMGINYMPDEKNEIQSDQEGIGEKIFADEHSHESKEPNIKLPDTAVVVSSGGLPLNDLDAPSETH